MKVGTDGVILGAWADPGKGGKALDVGTGTGLLAMMLCQRCENLLVDAVEIDCDAADQAKENIAASKFAGRIRLIHKDFRDFEREKPEYDLVISNPPYFSEKVFSPVQKRNIARNASALSPEVLISNSCRLLKGNGSLALILPASGEGNFRKIAEEYQLFPNRRLSIIPSPGKEPGRICLQFSRNRELSEDREMIIEAGGRHRYSEEYVRLTREFYL